MMKRKICVFTGSRAEYGLLKPLMDEVKKDRRLELQIVVSGMHMASDFGLTYREIENDGFLITRKIEILSGSDNPVSLCGSIGLGIKLFGRAFAELKPDLVVILGDRFEAFAAASSAMMLNIPIAHIHGGEATFGVIDEPMRHSITKMSLLHFTSTEAYRKRVIQLGELPERVYNVGAVGLGGIKSMRLLSRKELEKRLGFRFGKRNLLVTFHPATLERGTSEGQFRNLLEAADCLKDTRIIFTKSNADTGGRTINKMIDGYVSKNRHKATAFTSMGRLAYLSILQFVECVMGNSSSGIIEAPSFKVATINIGDREKGRVRASSVIDCRSRKDDIIKALKKARSPAFKAIVGKTANPYYKKDSAKIIKETIKHVDLDSPDILKKVFFDIEHVF